VVFALAVAPAVRADDGAGPPEGGQTGAAAETSAHAVGAPGTSEDAPGHAAGAPGNSENAPGHAGGAPGNSENAPGHADDGAAGPPKADVDQGMSIGQTADASASAAQDTVGNTQVTVRVDEPGNGQPIGQENRAEADAGASASAVVDGGGEGSIDQAVQADAAASQVDVANTVVTVRVGSPGDDASVVQANIASAGATSAGDGGTPGSESAQATATQVGASNTSVSVRVFSPGDDGPVSQTNEAAAAAHAGDGSGEGAAASQDGARNTSVSIRVESPGTSADVFQASTTTADVTSSGGGIAVATTTDAVNTVVAVAVDGTALDHPGAPGLQIWVWEWVWARDEAESVESLLGGDVNSWTWVWDGKGPRHGTVTSRTAGEDDRDRRGGSWDWRWDWNRNGVAGWTWGWDWHESLVCDSCVWIWNWTWNWTGAPADNGSATSQGAAGAPGSAQVNVARANAEATLAVDVSQDALQDGAGPGGQYAGQLVQVEQRADALAEAMQDDVASLTRGAGRHGTANIVESDASVVLDATLTQAVEQLLEAAAGATADQWSGQEVVLGQLGAAEAVATQHDATLTAAGTHGAFGVASATGTVSVDQRVEQDATAAGGTVEQWAGQLTLVEQAVDAGATVDQAGTARSRAGGGTASASSTAGGLLLVDQSTQQASARAGGIGSQAAAQLAYAAQDATARATTTQQAGAAVLPLASSDAGALNRAAVVQQAAQSAVGASGLDVQELLQQSIVVQIAIAVSTSNGGIAGSASVVNCAVTQQGAGQSLAAGAPATAAADLTAFCLPGASRGATSVPQGDEPSVPLAIPPGVDSTAAPTAIDVESNALHGARATASRPPRAAALRAPDRAAPTRPRPLLREAGSPLLTKISAPPSTQARLDTRPGSSAGAGDAGREPPLPPVGDPPTWISALAAAASSAGASGIAAILLAFALVPPLLLRVLEGSVVRRPTGVLAQVEVPI
jgi:hypothetical protein